PAPTAISTLSLHDALPISALERPDLLAEPVRSALATLPDAAQVEVTEIDPDLADTAALVAATGLPMAQMANCLVVAGRRGEVERSEEHTSELQSRENLVCR